MNPYKTADQFYSTLKTQSKETREKLEKFSHILGEKLQFLTFRFVLSEMEIMGGNAKPTVTLFQDWLYRNAVNKNYSDLSKVKEINNLAR